MTLRKVFSAKPCVARLRGTYYRVTGGFFMTDGELKSRIVEIVIYNSKSNAKRLNPTDIIGLLPVTVRQSAIFKSG